MIPIIVIMCFFGYRAYKDAMSILSLVKDNGAETLVKDDHKITSMNYLLRDNETELQLDLFTQLKNAVEGNAEGITEEQIAELVVMNHVADFYTWTNKLGQYDIGGMYYIPEYSRENAYLKARDGFYQYLNEYIDKYGSENLLEVASVEASAVKSDTFTYKQIVKYYNLEDDNDFNEYTREDIYKYPSYNVTCKWTYKTDGTFSTSKYPTTQKFKVIYNKDANRYEIALIGSFDSELTVEVSE